MLLLSANDKAQPRRGTGELWSGKTNQAPPSAAAPGSAKPQYLSHALTTANPLDPQSPRWHQAPCHTADTMLSRRDHIDYTMTGVTLPQAERPKLTRPAGSSPSLQGSAVSLKNPQAVGSATASGSACPRCHLLERAEDSHHAGREVHQLRQTAQVVLELWPHPSSESTDHYSTTTT